MILKLWLDTRVIWMIFIKILKNTIQMKKVKYWLCLMIADMLSNQNVNPVVTELFIRGRELDIYLVFITQFFLFKKVD